MIKKNTVTKVVLGFFSLAFLTSVSHPNHALPLREKGIRLHASEPFQKGVVEYKGKWYKSGDTIYGYNDYVKLVVGDVKAPLFLGIPHDGIMKGDPEIPRATTSGRDAHTKPFTFEIAKLFKKDTGLQPWIIICEINRMRVDANTFPNLVNERYGVNTEARKTYDSYHELMLLARSTMARHLAGTTGGLFIDMHGHGHKYANGREENYISVVNGRKYSSNFIKQSDVAYAISGDALEKPDSELDKLAEYSSIYAIAKAHSSIPFSQLIRGPYSLGALLDDEGVTAVPGKLIPILDRNKELFGVDNNGEAQQRPYYNGGYLIRKYGSGIKPAGGRIGFPDNISSIQIESPGITVLKGEEERSRSTHQFKRAIIKYLNHWYGYDFENSPYPYKYYK